MPAPLLTAIEMDYEVAQAVDLVLSGKTTREAGAIMGMSHEAVRTRIKKAREIYRETYIAAKMGEWVGGQLLRLDHIQRQAMLAWHRSIGQVITRTTKDGENGSEVTEKIENQAGDPRYLDTYLRAEQRRAELLGLDAPKRLDVGLTTEFVANPERRAREAGLTLEDAHAMIEAALSGERSN